MAEIFQIALEYGLGAIALLGVIWLFIMGYKLERRVFGHDKSEEECVKLCKKHSNYFKDSFDRINNLETKDVESDGRFDNIDTQLKHLDEKVSTISSGVDKIVDHFVQKGMQ